MTSPRGVPPCGDIFCEEGARTGHCAPSRLAASRSAASSARLGSNLERDHALSAPRRLGSPPEAQNKAPTLSFPPSPASTLVRGQSCDEPQEAGIMEARDIMSKEVITLAPDLRMGEATDLLLRYRIHGAPVAMPDGQLIGMISFMDLARRAGEDATVRDVMSSDPVVAYEDTPADEVARI